MKKTALILAATMIFSFANYLEANPVTPKPQRETTKTQDGVNLVFLRYARPGAQPVILVHGLAQNAFHWDLSIKGKSFAKYLYHQGFDVWAANLRSHGKGKFKSESSKRWCVDDFAIYDVDAIVNKVLVTTKKRPFYIGFSMGGMVAYMYLQGVVYGKHKRVESKLNLILQRNQKIKGLITIASPVKMAWKYQPSVNTLVKKSYYDYNLVLDALPGRKSIMYSFHLMPKIPLPKIIKSLGQKQPWGSQAPKIDKKWISTYGNQFPFSYAWHPQNMSPQIIEAVLQESIDSISGRVLAQFTHWCVNRTLCEYNVWGRKKNPYIYSDHMYKIACPLYVIAGDKDKLVCDNVVEKFGFKSVSSQDKSFQSFPGFGHVDLCVGLKAPSTVYPAVTKWLRQRMKNTH